MLRRKTVFVIIGFVAAALLSIQVLRWLFFGYPRTVAYFESPSGTMEIVVTFRHQGAFGVTTCYWLRKSGHWWNETLVGQNPYSPRGTFVLWKSDSEVWFVPKRFGPDAPRPTDTVNLNGVDIYWGLRDWDVKTQKYR